MKRISLHGKYGEGKYALIDDEDYEIVSLFRWNVNTGGYVYTYQLINGQRENILMHRLINNTPKKFSTDHIDHNTLNNLKYNLRTCTHQQNMHNRKQTKICSSKFKGVSWDKQTKKWRALIRFNNIKKSIGYFNDEIEAAEAYNTAAVKMFGKHAYLNIIQPRKVL